MRLADFKCKSCGILVERDLSAATQARCPHCGARMVRKYTFAGLGRNMRDSQSSGAASEVESAPPPSGTNTWKNLQITNCGGVGMTVRGGANDIQSGRFANNRGGDIVADGYDYLRVRDVDFD